MKILPLIEELLDEATFNGEEHLRRHYDNHVLQSGEERDYNDPKFDEMSKQEYFEEAEQATLADAQIIETEEDLKNARGIIGWVANRPNWRNPRNIKINLSPEKYPGYITIVAYVDDANAGNQIFSYMLGRRGNKYREFRHKVDELPENK